MQKTKTTKERLDKFLKHLDISQAKFAENVGLSKGYVNNVGDSIREDNLKKITAVYPDLNVNWLKTGEGLMMSVDYINNLYKECVEIAKKCKFEVKEDFSKYPVVKTDTFANNSYLDNFMRHIHRLLEILGEQEYNVINNTSMSFASALEFLEELPEKAKYSHIFNPNNIKSSSVYIPDDLTQVLFVNRNTAASFVESYCDETQISETIAVTELTEQELKKHKYIVFEVAGNSMEPTLKDKSRILAKFIDPSDWEYCSGGVFVVCYKNFLVVKRIKKNDLMLGDVLTLSSDNETAGEMTIRKSDITGIWEAVRIVNQKIE